MSLTRQPIFSLSPNMVVLKTFKPFTKTFISHIDYWIGLQRTIDDTQFRWLNGDIPSFTKWYQDQPSAFTSNEFCVFMFNGTDLSWHDAPCGWLSNFICADTLKGKHTMKTHNLLPLVMAEVKYDMCILVH